MNNFSKIVTSFAKRSLGALAGEILLEDYKKRFRIHSLDQLTKKQQSRFIDAFLWGVFHRHLPKARIDAIKLQLNLHFCIGESTTKISQMLGKSIVLEPLEVRYQSFENFEKIVNNLEEGIIVITVRLSGYVVGTVLLFIFRDSAIRLGNLMLESMLGMSKSDDFLDDMKQSAIREFFNIVLPTFADTIANTLNQSIMLNIAATDLTNRKEQVDNAFSKMNFNSDAQYGIRRILSTPFKMVIDDLHDIGGMFFLLMENEPEVISDSLDKTYIKTDDTLERLDLDKIVIPKDPNRYKSVMLFLSNFMSDNPEDVVDPILNELGIQSLNNCSVGLKRQFVNSLVKSKFAGVTPKVSEFITNGCSLILGLGVTAEDNKDDKDDDSALSRLIRKSG